ncbi:MAG: YkgJ family cysteine cluster protein [Ardenticatenales bacterium]|nr:YkgJ family cysteine cluster protein [Ardenticatenales bacterium]MCB9172035.1 YkgJ family cysteine cluster protein [Ardenticatenales bacterium]
MPPAATDDGDRAPASACAALDALYTQIAQRVGAATAARGAWPCAKGCDGCCRRLAALPHVTAAEWQRMAEGLALLPAAEQAAIRQRIDVAARGGAAPPHVVCPFLHDSSGACSIYDHRPAACRMYGFYVARSGNQWCDIVQALDDNGELNGLILGNFDAMARQLQRQFGPTRPINEWLAESAESAHGAVPVKQAIVDEGLA